MSRENYGILLFCAEYGFQISFLKSIVVLKVKLNEIQKMLIKTRISKY